MVTVALGIGCACFVAPASVYADGTNTVTLGADLTEDQKDLVLSYFGITDENRDNYNFIEINNQEEREALDGIIPLEQIGTKTYSCACIEPTNSGGISVETTNLTYVTDNMIASALTTAGVANCNVKAASPFDVSGTGALTGAIKAYEVATEEQLSDEKKDIANEEIKTSVDLANEIGQDSTTIIINNAKEDVMEKSQDKDLTEEDIRKIVEDVLNENSVELSAENQKELTSLLAKISEQDYDLETVKNNLDKVSEKLSDATEKLNDAANNLTSKENQEEVKGFFGNLIQTIKDFFNSLFGGEQDEQGARSTEQSVATEESEENTAAEEQNSGIDSEQEYNMQESGAAE